jgi:hypothetical protein
MSSESVISVNQTLKNIVLSLKFLESQGTEIISILSLKMNTSGDERLCSTERKILKAIQCIKEYVDGDLVKAVNLTRLGYSVVFVSPTLFQLRKTGFVIAIDMSTNAIKGKFVIS